MCICTNSFFCSRSHLHIIFSQMNFEVCSRVADTIFTFQAENLGAKIPRAEACKLIGARGSGVETGFLF